MAGFGLGAIGDVLLLWRPNALSSWVSAASCWGTAPAFVGGFSTNLGGLKLAAWTAAWAGASGAIYHRLRPHLPADMRWPVALYIVVIRAVGIVATLTLPTARYPVALLGGRKHAPAFVTS